MASKTTEEWVASLPKSQRDKHTYQDAIFTGVDNKIEITCLEHGNFWQQAYAHKRGSGCPQCFALRRGSSQRSSKDSFVAKTLLVPAISGKYDYSQVEYVNGITPVVVICPDHGPFKVTPGNHLAGKGCLACYSERRYLNNLSTTEEFVRKATLVQETVYDYSLVEYVNCKKKVQIICKDHGVFKMTPDNHLQGNGCPKCKKCGYNVGKPGQLYVLSDGRTTKVGITNRTPLNRAKEVKKSGGPLLEVSSSFYFEDGSIPLALESKVHTYLRSQYQQVSEVFDGSTECFYNVDLEALTSFIVPLATPTETNNRPNI